jgi:tRNA (adenine37-N6)-methyltransferase
LLCVFHQSSEYTLLAKTFLDDKLLGLFATRYPFRPNQIGLTVLRLTARQWDTLEIEGVDILDGTPLLDTKPYVEEFDVRSGTRSGWYPAKN